PLSDPRGDGLRADGRHAGRSRALSQVLRATPPEDGSMTSDDAAIAVPVPIVHIRPARGWIALRLRDVWEYRELLYFLVWRDVKVRYKQTALGAAWAILQPLLAMIVFTIFFGKLAGVGSDGLPYPIFSYAGLLPWTLFAFGLNQSSDS